MGASQLTRRHFLQRLASGAAAFGALALARWMHPMVSMADTGTPHAPLPTRPLGRTGVAVSLLGLGGEGVLRTWGQARAAAHVIERALDVGITYYDTAPAYSGSQDYYGAVLGERRRGIFLASKTHERTRDGSLRLLDESLKRLHTDHLDLWQLHDLRSQDDLDEIFADKTGALAALTEARAAGRVRFLGITGHTDPAVLVEAMRRFPFDTVLVALNAADKARLSFIASVLPEAQQRQMGVIGMKVVGRGLLLPPHGPLTAADAIHYVLSLSGVSTVIIGCETPEEVEENARIARTFQPLIAERLAAIERTALPHADDVASYKRSALHDPR